MKYGFDILALALVFDFLTPPYYLGLRIKDKIQYSFAKKKGV